MTTTRMKMIMAVVPRHEAEHVLQVLISAGHRATFTEGRGGMLRQAQQMLFIVVNEKDLEAVLKIIQDECHSQVRVASSDETPSSLDPTVIPTAATVAETGGAVVFVWDIDRFEVY